jgi:tetratricopeptide (TPR) repeat protein
VLPWSILVQAERGDPAAAAAYDEFEKTNMQFAPKVVADQLVETRTRLVMLVGGSDRAQRVREDVEIYTGELVASDSFIYGAAERATGNLYAIEGRHAEAIPLLEHALSNAEGHRLRGLVVDTRIDLARALHAHREPGDAERAHLLLREALDVAETLRLSAAAREARQLLT